MRLLITSFLGLIVAFGLASCTSDNATTPRGEDLEVSTVNLPTAVEGAPYSVTLAAIGQFGPFTWAIAENSPSALPPNLTLNATSGILSGTPIAGSTGTYQLKVQVTSSRGTVATKTLSLAIAPILAITTTTLAPAQSGVAYAANLSSSGGSGVATWALAATSANQLPNGIVLNAMTGALTGTPAFGSEASYSLTFTVTDSGDSKSKTFTLLVSLGPVKVTSAALPDALELTAYMGTLVAMGGSGNYTWSVSPTSADPLPAGFVLDPATGIVTGTSGPQSTGTYNITFIVNDGTDSHEMSVTFKITPGALSIFTTSLAAAQEGATYGGQILATGGSEIYVWTVDAASASPLPAGLSLATNGTFTGSTAFDTQGTYNITFRVNDGTTQLTTTLVLTVNAFDPSAILDSLMAAGGGQGGGVIDADDTLFVRVASSHGGAVVANFDVLLSDANGDALIQGTTNISGELSFDISALPSVPQMITFYDAGRRNVVTRIASANRPLAQVHAYVFGNQQGLTVTVNHGQANKDLVVTLNGEVVHMVDNAGAIESFDLLNVAVFNPNQPWLLVAHLYENAVVGKIDMQTLHSAAYIHDSVGEAQMAAPRAIDINVDSGAGTNNGNIVSGSCSIATMTGSVSAPTLGSGLLTFAWIYAQMQGPFGVATYNRRVLSPSVASGNFEYILSYPTFDGLASANFTQSARQVMLPVGTVAIVGQIPNNLPALRDVPKLIMRSNDVGLGVVDFDFSGLPTIGISSIFANVDTPTKANAALTDAAVSLRIELSGGISLLTSARGATGSLDFPMLAGVTAPLTFAGAQVAFAAPGNAGFGFSDGSLVARSTLDASGFLASIVGNGDSGTPANRIALSGGAHPIGALTAELSAALPATLSEATGVVTLNATGLENRLGTWALELKTQPAGVFGRNWRLEIDSRASLGGQVSFTLPTLPIAYNGSFVGLNPSARAWFIDQHASGIDPANSGANAIQRPTALSRSLGTTSFERNAYLVMGSDLSAAFAPVTTQWDLELGGFGVLAVGP